MKKATYQRLIEECRQEAIRQAGGSRIVASDGDVIFDANTWKPTAEDIRWVLRVLPPKEEK